MAEQRTPPHASDEALAAFAMRRAEHQEDADDPEARHIGQCQECQAEVAHIKLLLRQLDQHVYRLECPSVEQLTAYALGELGATERRRIAAHVQGCARCADEVAITREVLAPANPPGALAAIRRVLAGLVPSQSTLTPALNLRDRSRPDEDNAPRIFRAEGVEITLRSEADRGNAVLYGMIGRDEADAGTAPISVRLLQSIETAHVEPAVAATADVELDAFELGPVPSGTYQVEVLLADRVIVIPSLTL